MSECFSRKLRHVKIHYFEEIRSSVLELFKERIPLSSRTRVREKIYREIYTRKIDRSYDKLISMIRECASLPLSHELHMFYKELLRLYSLEDVYNEMILRCRNIISITRDIRDKYKSLIKNSSNKEEMKRYVREFIGRILSVAKRKLRGKDVDVFKKIVRELSSMPCFEEDVMKIVLTGMPQVGKSTFISKISNAQPEISVYPFTTKKIIAGHFIDEKKGIRIMLLDTPGLLDRSVEEMNEIELKAVAALKHMADVAIFLIDPRREFYYTIDQQLKVLDTVRSLLGEKKFFIAINKIDISSEEEIAEAEKKIIDLGYSKEMIYKISAAKNIGLTELIYDIYNTFLKKDMIL